MSVFKKFEKKLESLFEGAFARALKTKIEPIEIAHQLERAMEESTVDGLRKTFTANIYKIRVNKKDYLLLRPFLAELLTELESFIREKAAEKNAILPGKVEVEFEESDRVKAGEIKVIPQIRKDDIEELMEKEKNLDKTQVISLAKAEKSGLFYARAYLEDLSTGKMFYLTRFPARIGRIDSNDVRLSDPAISRIHAEVLLENSDFILRDLESTNGTKVNGRRIRQKKLSTGDIVTIGETKMRWVTLD